MASVMKELMDIFYEETEIDSDNYARSYVFNIASNLANNCHQKTALEIKNILTTAFAHNAQGEEPGTEEKAAWEDALLLVTEYFNP